MIGTALDDDVPGFHHCLVFIEDQSDLPFEHDAVVDGGRAMHERMTITAMAAGEGICPADILELLQGFCRVGRGVLRGLGRKFVDPDTGAAHRWGEHESGDRRIHAEAIDGGRCPAGIPNFEETGAIRAHRPLLRGAGIACDDGHALVIVAGDDAPERFRHIADP